MLCGVVQKKSSWIWNTLRTARLHESKVGEESITDFLVLELKKAAKDAYYINSFTRPQEKISGADWELWFTGQSGAWIGLRVQAKVISLAGTRFPQLHYKQKDGTHQIDRLISDAQKHNAVPLYCLYCSWPTGSVGKLQWPCGSVKKNVRLFGASILSVAAVKSLKASNDDSLKSVAKCMSPFHCIFCCQGYGGSDLPSRVQSFLANTGFSAPVGESILRSPPNYLRPLLDPGADQETFDFPDSNLARITVIRELPRRAT